jgi:hypothetical protein
VQGTPFGGAARETSTAKLVAGHESFVPLRRKVLDLLEMQDRGLTVADDVWTNSEITAQSMSPIGVKRICRDVRS